MKAPSPHRRRAPVSEEQGQIIREMIDIGFKTKTIARELALAFTTIEKYLRTLPPQDEEGEDDELGD